MTDEQRDKLLRRMAAQQLRMGQMLVTMAGHTASGLTKDEVAEKLGEQNYYLERAVCETGE